MNMKKQVATLIHNGQYKVIFDDSTKMQPYRIIYISNYKQKQLAKCADLPNAMKYLALVTMERR